MVDGERLMAHSTVTDLSDPNRSGALIRPAEVLRARQDDASAICDFRPGCTLIFRLTPNDAAYAQSVISSTPHLAQALFELGLTAYGAASIEMALAVQEARECPFSDCSCALEQRLAASDVDEIVTWLPEPRSKDQLPYHG
jgi:hypothetical protein